MTPAEAVLATFGLFCRIGGCLMIMPGFSSARLPVRVRLMAAIAITLALAPSTVEAVGAVLRGLNDSAVILIIFRETFVGGLIGFLGRIFFAALDTLCAGVAMATGFGNVFGTRIDEPDSVPELASFIMLCVTALFFITDQHAQVVRALAASYDVMAFGAELSERFALVQVADALVRAFRLALQITGPLILYGLLANFAFGLLNRLTPQIQVYFISTPFVILGALVMLYLTGATLITLFTDAFSSWLVRG